ncbi:MAG: hypothetical protein ACJ74U_10875 [Jatrophihabitantaceae bacterium]
MAPAAGLALITLLSACGGPDHSNDTITSSFTPAPLTSPAPGSTASPFNPYAEQTDTSHALTTEASNQPAAGTSSSLTYIGSMTQTWTGASTTTAYSIGTPTFGDSSALPDGVAGACQLTDPAVLDSAAYFPIRLTVSFSGQVTTDVLVAPDGALQNEATPLRVGGAYIAFTDDAGTSQWNCDDSTQNYSLGPGSRLTINTWVIVPNLVTNQNPHPVIDVFNTWSLAPPATLLVTSPPSDRASGPHAAICHDGDQRLPVLSLFIAPPYRYGGETGLPVQCSPA